MKVRNGDLRSFGQLYITCGLKILGIIYDFIYYLIIGFSVIDIYLEFICSHELLNK